MKRMPIAEIELCQDSWHSDMRRYAWWLTTGIPLIIVAVLGGAILSIIFQIRSEALIPELIVFGFFMSVALFIASKVKLSKSVESELANASLTFRSTAAAPCDVTTFVKHKTTIVTIASANSKDLHFRIFSINGSFELGGTLHSGRIPVRLDPKGRCAILELGDKRIWCFAFKPQTD